MITRLAMRPRPAADCLAAFLMEADAIATVSFARGNVPCPI
ncbi:hypothetical protein MPQ_0422 [Methylovorus sp. MP688]|nr:hypothetical protein MPQ_0422 [Methylovorus sp. MP688]